MKKVALLIGVSDYQIGGSNQGFTDIPSARLDIKGMQRILENAELGAFDLVKPLLNPAPHFMSETIETFLSEWHKDDLVLLYFSGHGAKDDDRRKLYFAASGTKKTAQDKLMTSTAVSAEFVREKLTNCKATKKIMILDCCFSGAIDPNAKGDDNLEVLETEFSRAKGTIILTSSSSTQLSQGHSSQMSHYTRYLVHGIESGEADQASLDGYVSIKELHDYISKKLEEDNIATMTPQKFLPKEDGLLDFRLIKVPLSNPHQAYRKEIENCIRQGLAENGEFNFITQIALKKYQTKLKNSSKVEFSSTDAKLIEDELLQPIKQHLDHLEVYRGAFRKILEEEGITDKTRKHLNYLQKSLELTNEEVAAIEKEVNAQSTPLSEDQSTFTHNEILCAFVEISNLATDVTEENLKAVFSEYGIVRGVYLSKGNSNKSPCAFVEMSNKTEATNATDALDEAEWMGRDIQVKLAISNKCQIAVSNLATDVTEKALKAIFSEYGTVKGVYLSKDNSNKSPSAFVEMSNKTEATNATDALDEAEWMGREIQVKLAG